MSQAGAASFNSSASFIQTLTGNSGGPVGPDGADNINVIGNNTSGINVVGMPGSNTLSISGIAASTSQRGTASFDSTDFSVVAGFVSLLVHPGFAVNYTDVTTTPYVVTSTDYYLSVNTAIAITIQLPNAPTANRLYIIKDRTGNAGIQNITVTTVGGAVNIDGATSFLINSAYQSIQLLFNGTSYEVF